MNRDFVLDSDIVTANPAVAAVSGFAQKTVGYYYNLSLALIILLVIVILYMMYWGRQHFMPSQTMNQQAQDSVNVGSSNTPHPASTGILGSPASWYNPMGGQSSDAIAYCSNADAIIPNDAWSWQYNQVSMGDAASPPFNPLQGPGSNVPAAASQAESMTPSLHPGSLSAILYGH